jgi:hypothetical protein
MMGVRALFDVAWVVCGWYLMLELNLVWEILKFD